MEIAASPSLAYLSKADIRRHIHEGLKPYQHLADQAGMHFLSYLLSMAVLEASCEADPAAARSADDGQDDDDDGATEV
jgi:hypothetical protein